MQYNYWAIFKKVGKDVYRLDTRIYLKPIEKISTKDQCIGAIVGKNPGSAQGSKKQIMHQPIQLSGDKFLPTLKSILCKTSYPFAKGEYIQVMNLFYLCDKNLMSAIKKYKHKKHKIICSSEANYTPWIWYAWGSSNKELNPFKKRFEQIKCTRHFYYDKEKHAVCATQASTNSFAKHLQGLPHTAALIQHLEQLLDNKE